MADFKTARATLERDTKGLCRNLLKGGIIRGDWWVVAVPWRKDKNPSLGVSLTTGRWRDFGRDEGGDLLDLLARVQNRPVIDIVRELCPPNDDSEQN